MIKTMSKHGGRSALRLLIFGLAAGFFNGLLGAGGGILLVFGLTPLLAADPEGQRDVFANALAVMLPVTVVSLITYLLSGRIENSEVGVFVIPAAVGGLIGAVLLDRLKVRFLNRLFALIVIWSGAYMLFK